MLPNITQDSPLAAAVAGVIQPKLVEIGWSTDDGQEGALIEYIVLMLVNGKTQEELATELSNDFLGLEEGDTQALEFSRWLFAQVEALNQQINGGPPVEASPQPVPSFDQESAQVFQMQGNNMDAEMGDASDIPTGPKSMRNNRNAGKGRMLNQINRNLDRPNDGALHRVRGQQGNGRINGHGGRDQMRGNRRGGRNMNGMGMQGPMGGPMMQMSPENQMQLMTMLEEQARMMSQLMPGFVPPAVNPAFQNGNQQGRSLFDRVERQGQRGGGRFNKRGQNQRPQGAADVDMDTEMGGEQTETNPDGVCRFNLRCTRKDCEFAHQSPAAPEGTSVDVSDVCSFGAACKNRKCTGRHPSPAVKSAHQSEEVCRFFPRCTNPHCHFKHPDMPRCRNGADCKEEGCKFTHIQVACKFNPCMNPSCPYKHAEGQRGSFPDKVWTANRVSERKFVTDEGAEELIKPETAGDGSQNQEELIA
ncbi:hypothetical protein N7528_004626 [Penicillium herquei]|nr:hypothetical protein N7528_004626 [Penicillium herquei]